jgi:membrane fusion protein, multidrug efflux system
VKIKKKYIWLLAIVFAIALIAFFFYYISAYTSNAYIRANWVEISPRVEGYVDKISIANNQFVKKGDTLFTLDRYPYLMKVEKMKAQLKVARAQEKYLVATITTLREQAKSAENELELMEIERTRYRILSSDHAESMQRYQTILISYNEIKQKWQNLNGQLKETIELDIKQKRNIELIQAELNLAEYHYKHTIIKAPFDGYLTNMYLMRGQYLVAGEPVFGVAQTQACWVEANFKECWVGKVKPGQSVWIMSDLYPFNFFRGKVESITNAVNRTPIKDKVLPYIKPTIDWVRLQYRFTVIIKLENLPKDMHLRMGADARVLVWL